MEGPEILHGEFLLESRYGLLQKCCAGCGEDNVINVKQQVYRICVAPVYLLFYVDDKILK
jgi:hypothetical protein